MRIIEHKAPMLPTDTDVPKCQDPHVIPFATEACEALAPATGWANSLSHLEQTIILAALRTYALDRRSTSWSKDILCLQQKLEKAWSSSPNDKGEARRNNEQ